MLEMRSPPLKISSEGSWTCGARIGHIDRIPLMVAALLIVVYNSVTCTVHLLHRQKDYDEVCWLVCSVICGGWGQTAWAAPSGVEFFE